MYTSRTGSTRDPLPATQPTCRDGRDLVRAAARAYADAITDARGLEECRRLERSLLQAVEARRRHRCARCVGASGAELLGTQ